MMPLYLVRIPVVGYVTVEVEADSEKEAIDKGLESAQFEVTTEGTTEAYEFETYRKIVEGNVCHVWTNRASAELIEE